MKRVLMGLMFWAAAVAAAAAEQALKELRLTDGRTLRSVVVLNYARSSFMARWEGGRGAIAYESVEGPSRASLEKQRDAGMPKEAPAPQTPPSDGKLQIGKIGAREVESGSGYTHFAWQAEIVNGTGETQRVEAKIYLLDKAGFEMDSDTAEAIYLKSGERKTVGGKSIVKEAVWLQVDKYLVKLR